MNKITTSQDAGQAMALQALAFLAADSDLLDGFLATTGLHLGDVRDLAADIDFQAGVLDYVLANEPLLISFAVDSGVRPQDIVAARSRLPGASDAA
jgi:Protein of unknown function (DUF3572)